MESISRYNVKAKARYKVMYQKNLEKNIRCPLKYGMELFGGKWNSRIICMLPEPKDVGKEK